ncbi:F-box domain-containing protein [Apiospora phragmitis]|uniref:F-box domain-containing protein n=1 Tax=Apiospora phragmitis TaxID=2905665 RepID=A0ABR1W5M1_9PEZI
MSRASSSSPSPPSAIPWVEGLAADRRRRGSSNSSMLELDSLPNEVLTHVLSFLEVCDLLATSRTNRHLRALSLHPLLHMLRLRRARASLPPLLFSPSRPTLRDLIAKHIFLTHTTQISRRLARNLVAIRLSRRLPLRPSAETLVQRGVLPGECVPGAAQCREGSGAVVVAPGLVAKKRAVERERLKDGLRRWVACVWTGEVRERAEGVRRWEEQAGVGRVWRLKRFWERVGGKAAGVGETNQVRAAG